MSHEIEQWHFFQHISQAISNQQELNTIFELMAAGFSTAFPNAHGRLYLLKDQNHMLYCTAVMGDGTLPDTAVALAGKPLWRQVIDSGETCTIDKGDGVQLLIPIKSEGAVRGLFCVDYLNRAHLRSGDVASLETLASQIGIVLGCQKLAEQAHQRTRQLETIYSVSESAGLLQPLEPTLAEIHAQLIRTFNPSVSFIALYDQESETVSFPFAINENESLTLETRSIFDEKSLVAWVVRNNQPYASANWIKADRPVPGIVHKGNIRSLLCFPMRAQDSVVGAISIQSEEADVFDESDYQLLAAVASHAASIIKNARLHEEVQRQLVELTTLHEASATMMADLDQDSVLQAIVKEMARALPVDGCAIFVWDIHGTGLQMAARTQRPQMGERGQVGFNLVTHLEQHPIVRRVVDFHEMCFLHRGSDEEEMITLLTAAGLESVLLAPLIWRSQVLGLLALEQALKPRPFTPQEIRLARNLAGQAAVAMEHSVLFSKAQRRVEELAAFHDIALHINTALELNVVLDTITESALKLISASNVHIYLYDGHKEEFSFGSARWRDGRRTPAVAAPRVDGLTATVVRQAEAVVIDNAPGHPFFQTQETSTWGVGAIAGFPLKRGDWVLGAFTVTYLHAHIFSEDELLLLSLLADQAAVAVENARLFADAQRGLRDMSALVNMAQQVTGNLKVESVMETTVHLLQQLLGARASTIALLAEDGIELVIEAAAGIDPKWVHEARIKVGEGVSGRAVSKRQPAYIRDTHSESDFLFFDEIVRSLLAVPIISRDQVIGAMTVDSDQPNAFDQSDIQIMTIAAAQVSVAIANARLYEEAEDRAAKLALAYDELKESDRLKDELVQNVSHELRTPLTFVKGYVDLLMDGEMGDINTQQQSALRIVADKSVEITRLIDDIMSLQRIDTSNLVLEQFSMTKLIQEAVAGHSLSAGKRGVYFASEGPSDKVLLLGDKGRINQALNNLIVNAVKFSPDGGTVRVSLSVYEDNVEVVVADEGIGMPPDKIDRIFERFYQVDGSSRRRFGGTGIGLAIVKRIVEAHQGQIWVESEVNQGSSFYFTLPKAVKREVY